MPTLRALECLVALVEHGSMSKGAAAMYLSQPAMSHHIAALERELGVPLVERLWRGVRVTAAGCAAAEQARLAVRASERVVEVGQRVGSGHAGRLRISCVETMTGWLLAPALRHWRSRRPDVTLELSEFTSTDVMAKVLETGGTDIAVGSRPTQTAAHVEVIGQQEMAVIAPAGHRFTDMAEVPIQALADEMFVHYDPANAMAAWIDQFTAFHKVVLKPAVRTRSPRTAAHLAAAGLGVAIVPVSALAPRPVGVVRRLRPVVMGDVVVMVATPSDTLVQAFVTDLRSRGVPSWSWPGVAEPSGQMSAQSRR